MIVVQWYEACRGRWADLHPLWRLLLVAVVLGGGVLFGLKPAYRVFKGWRLERNLEAAKVAEAEVRMDAARDLSLTVLRAGDPRIEAFRILERSMEALRDPMHGEIARALMSHPEGSDEDRLRGFRGVAPDAPLGLVGQAWTTLPEHCRQQAAFAEVFAKRLLAGKRHGEAASVLLGVPEAARTVAVQQGLIRALLGSGKPEGLEEGQRRLAAQWPATDAGPSGWLDVLEEIPVPRLRPDLLGPVRRFLEARAESEGAADSARHALALARLDYVANFSGRGELIDRTISRWQAESPLPVARFLRDLGLHQRLLETFPAERVPERPELLPDVLEALEETGAWAGVKPLLEAAGEKLPKYEMLAHLALAAGRSGDSAKLKEHWDAAVADAQFSTATDAFLRLSEIARRGGLESESVLALLEAVLRGRGPLPLYGEIKPLVEWLAAQGRENSLLQVCAIYLLFEPGNPVLLTQYAYLACLNSLVEPANILKAIKPMAEAFPEALPMQCVLAVAHLSCGDPAAALAVIDRQKVAPEQLAPGYRAVFLATLVLNGRIERQDPRIAGLPWKSLLPSERRRFSEWLKVEAK